MSLDKSECWYKSVMPSVNSDTPYAKGNDFAQVYWHSTFCMDHLFRIPVCIYFLRNKHLFTADTEPQQLTYDLAPLLQVPLRYQE